MITRRELLQVGAATAAMAAGGGAFTRALAQQRLTQDELTKFDALGNVTLLHVADIHGQLLPVYFREPSVNLGVGAAKGQPPHITGKDFLTRFGIPETSAAAYALTDQDFEALAKSYGRIGGLDRLATVVKRVRGERGDDRVLLLDGGDTWQGSLGANASKGQDMVDCVALLKPDAMTGHWEFTYGEARVKELVDTLGFPFLALNMCAPLSKRRARRERNSSCCSRITASTSTASSHRASPASTSSSPGIRTTRCRRRSRSARRC